MRSPGINGEGELRGQPANPGSPGKMAVETEFVCVCVCVCVQALVRPWVWGLCAISSYYAINLRFTHGMCHRADDYDEAHIRQ